MKIIVDKLPLTPSNCPYAEFHPYPPIVEEPGYYKCTLSHNACNLTSNCNGSCNGLSELRLNRINTAPPLVKIG